MNKNPTMSLLEAYSHIYEKINNSLQKKMNSSHWDLAIQQLKDVDIVPSASVPGVNLKNIRAKSEECYLNALSVCMENPQVKYVEGYMEVHGVPIDHAWNYYNRKHFDITEETLRQDKRKIECPHRSIMIIPFWKVSQFILETEVSGPYLERWLVELEKELV